MMLFPTLLLVLLPCVVVANITVYLPSDETDVDNIVINCYHGENTKEYVGEYAITRDGTVQWPDNNGVYKPCTKGHITVGSSVKTKLRTGCTKVEFVFWKGSSAIFKVTFSI